MLGVHADSLTRLCRNDLQHKGLAFFTTAPDGGHAKWFVDRSYDSRLTADGSSSDSNTEPDLSRYTKKQRQEALNRRACVLHFRAIRQDRTLSTTAIVQRVIAFASQRFPSLRMSQTSIYRWHAAYNSSTKLEELVSVRGGDRRHLASPEAWNAFRDLYLHENRPSIRQCWQEVQSMAAENGWTWCSYDACLRQVDKRVPQAVQIFHRDPKLYRTAIAPYTIQDIESWRAGEHWIGDHKQLDLICRFAGQLIRPWLTCWKDWRTRKVVGWVLSDSPNSSTILGALRHGLMDESNFGGPDCVWIDNGKDYDAWLFHGQTKKQRLSRVKFSVNEEETGGIFHKLGIDVHFSLAYNPNGKARLERWFRTLESFCKAFDTYTGESIDKKPERLAEIIAADRKIPAFELIRERIAKHIEGFNKLADHSMDDLSQDGRTISPNEAYAAWCERRRVMADPDSLNLLMMHWHKPLAVGRNGISLMFCGRTVHYGQFHPALIAFKGNSTESRPLVHVSFDPHDLRSIRVYDKQFCFICTAEINHVGGLAGRIDKDTVGEMQRRKSRYDRSQRNVAEYSLTQTLTPEEQLAEIAAEREETAAAVADDAQAPAALKIVRTPLDGQSKAIQQEELRPAVGSEGMDVRLGAMAMLDKIRANYRRRQNDDSHLETQALDQLREKNHEW